MSESWGCLKTTAVGCIALVVAAIAIPVGLAVITMRPIGRAADIRVDLETRYGLQEDYVPPPSGAPDPERVEAFLSVRRALSDTCDGFRQREAEIAKLEAFDSQSNVSRIEVLKQAFATTTSMMGMGPLIAHFFELRNRALLEVGMGLGEYSYLYVIVYGAGLHSSAGQAHLLGTDTTNARVHATLRSMLAGQLAEIDADNALRSELAAEIDRLDADPERLPWQDGLPAAIVESLDPFRSELDELRCDVTAPLELKINERHGVIVETL